MRTKSKLVIPAPPSGWTRSAVPPKVGEKYLVIYWENLADGWQEYTRLAGDTVQYDFPGKSFALKSR